MSHWDETDDLTAAVVDLLLYLKRRASEDAELANRLKALSDAVLADVSLRLNAEDQVEPPSPLPNTAKTAREDRSDLGQGKPPRPKRKWVDFDGLTLGRSSIDEESADQVSHPLPEKQLEIDVPMLERRLRLKAEGSRWAATRRRQLANGCDYATHIEPLDHDIIARARRLPDCFLWMCNSSGPEPDDLNLFELCGSCYEVAADAVELTRQIADESEFCFDLLEPGLELTAAAQSALRTILRAIDAPVDRDQIAIYEWLRHLADRHQTMINRYMRANDAADPTRHQNLAERIEKLGEDFGSRIAQERLKRKRIGKVRHKCSLVLDNPETPDSEWEILAQTVHDLIEGGLPPSNRELRELLLPVFDLRPGDLTWPYGFEQALKEIDRYLDLNPQVDELRKPSYAPEVSQVRRWVEGKSLFLIGGQRRRFSAEAIQKAFGLKELVWISTDEHAPLSTFQPSIAREDVVVVLLAIRWSSHSYGDVEQFCRQYGKPLVRLPRGYNANQIAVEIMQQCSERLEQQMA